MEISEGTFFCGLARSGGPFLLFSKWPIRPDQRNPKCFYHSLLAAARARIMLSCDITVNLGWPDIPCLDGHLDEFRYDVVRTVLKAIEDEVSPPRVEGRLSASGFYTSGDPRGWDKERMIEYIRSWVQGEAPLFKENEDWVRMKLGFCFSCWVDLAPPDGVGGFGLEDYTKEVIRWGTAGAASPPLSTRDTLPSLFPDLPKSSFPKKTAARITCLMFGDCSRAMLSRKQLKQQECFSTR